MSLTFTIDRKLTPKVFASGSPVAPLPYASGSLSVEVTDLAAPLTVKNGDTLEVTYEMDSSGKTTTSSYTVVKSTSTAGVPIRMAHQMYKFGDVWRKRDSGVKVMMIGRFAYSRSVSVVGLGHGEVFDLPERDFMDLWELAPEPDD